MDHNRASSDRNRPPQVLDGDQLTTPGLTPGTGMRRIEPAPESRAAAAAPTRRVGYGLPCANCGTYYAADVTVCPVCQSGERVSANQVQGIAPADTANEPVHGLASLPPVTADGEVIVDEEQLLAERDKFLREYKAKLFATHKLNAAVTFHCTLDHNHAHGSEPAAICKGCYDEMEQRADRLDAALRMDLKEAAEIIYEAVWSDPTPGDPGRTYRNAAEALLVELRRRAGMTLVLSPMKPYAH
ncbi:MAG TPA: hypothetical protein VE994_10965 [Terriglobales bacterium]|nr:hypothetical protein [Terriglobales bacterium]